jgi:hypothetical protein
MAETLIETRVYLRKQGLLSESRDLSAAPGAEFFGAIAAIFLPFLIGKAISGVSAALKKAGSEKTLKAAGRLPTYLYELPNEVGGKLVLNSNLGCVIIVRGRFSKPDDEKTPPLRFVTPGIFLSSGEEEEEKRIQRLNDNGIPVVELAAVYEGQIVLSDDETALLYKSRFLQVNEFQDGGNKRTLVVSIAISGAGEKEGEPVLSLAMMNFGELKRGSILGPNDLRSRRGSWLGGLGISDASIKAVEAMKLPAPKKPNPIGVMPVTVEGVLAETEEAKSALLFIAEVLDATKDDVSKAMAGEILKDRSKAVGEAADALEKLRQEEEEAYGAYLEAKSELATLGGDATAEARRAKEFAVERTKRAWQLKFEALKKFGVSLTHTE